MNSIARTMTIIAASMLFSAVPILADEGNMGSMESQIPQAQEGTKDECLLVAMNCGKDVDSIQERIDRLNREIGRGTDVYTSEELQKLREQVDDYNRQFELINENSGG
ncbi:hypothetical protein FO488_15760 [Geobacter sp. FeAm09]|uniref:hypothetical protein n=1 Tax=Geobacter sp. FeAm09 TaxID=2597769 RepID=UPI0011EE696F|nr:hypothetical protein [Geobacter sp. FeAm09]QEM69468.1 hypothetical protein FO488_15760 [Geobacter sp. FeAm09]